MSPDPASRPALARPRLVAFARSSSAAILVILAGATVVLAAADDLVVASAGTTAGPLSSADRADCERRTQEVFWQHRLWPKDNPGPRPAFSAVFPEALLRERADDGLRKSAALAWFWQRPVTGGQLQAEMDRMARDSKDPAMLRELFAALGNEPRRIAECLARPALVDRLVRRWYATDERFHGELKARARRELEGIETADALRSLGGEYSESASEKAEGGPGTGADDPAAVTRRVPATQWDEQLGRLRRIFAGRPEEVAPAFRTGSALDGPALPIDADRDSTETPVGRVSPLQEDEDGFWVVAVLAQSADRLEVARVTWRKRGFADWWGEARSSVTVEDEEPSFAYHLPATHSSSCTDDTWRPTPVYERRPASPHLFWTGTEMIVWGGSTAREPAFYAPATDTWRKGNDTGAPLGYLGSAVWTGTELLAWGGSSDGSSVSNQGGRYDPLTDSWTPMTTTNAPAARFESRAVWTGTEMIVWGGREVGSYGFAAGGRYNPATNTWVRITVPVTRDQQTLVWTGSEMIAWGGRECSPYGCAYVNAGLRYNPVANTWTPTSTAGAPSARTEHTAVWAGSEMIVWGGYDGTQLSNGARYDPPSDTWTSMSSTGAPTPRRSHGAVWTGGEMIVWGGVNGPDFPRTGARYDPAADRWLTTSTTNAPQGRYQHGALWNGTEMLVFGGAEQYDPGVDGGRYDPASNSWVAMRPLSEDVPLQRFGHAAVWTGVEMVIWGGLGPGYQFPILDSGAVYRPVTGLWAPMTTVNVPAARKFFAATWTGTEMLVWSGMDASGLRVTNGGRYNPATDSWLALPEAGSPVGRIYHTAVWTGTEMVVWGGDDNTGGRFDPATGTWSLTSTLNAPTAYLGHSALWTGSEMIVWGGSPGVTNAGGRYDPVTDSWAATSLTSAPSARTYHSAVWTGSEMIVWGGGALAELNDGARYNPRTDAWTPISAADAPIGRHQHTAAWTGSEMIVWGGVVGRGATDTGGRYNLSADHWRAMSVVGVPLGTSSNAAVWTGHQLITWGGIIGSGLSAGFATYGGGLYCALPPGAADLSVTQTGPASAAAGSDVVYSVTVRNNGPETATAVQVADPTPAGGLAFVSNSGDCTTAYPCSLGTLAPGQARTIATRFALPSVYLGPNPFTNTATVSCGGGTADNNPSNDSSSVSTAVTAASADLSLSKSGPAAALVGSDLVYTITVTNHGPSQAAGVTVADPTPAGLTFVSNAGACATSFPCSLGLVGSGASRAITSPFRVPAAFAGASVTNQAQVSASTADPVPGNNSAQATTGLIQPTPGSFFTITPCRVIDTRNPEGPRGGPALGAGAERTFAIDGACGVPATARAVAFNVTVTSPSAPGNLRLYPGGTTRPLVSAINYSPGQTRANNGIVTLGLAGDVAVFCGQGSGTTHFILDATGYFE